MENTKVVRLHISLSPKALDLQDATASKFGLTKSALTEMAIRVFAEGNLTKSELREIKP